MASEPVTTRVGELAAMIADVAGEDAEWAAKITAASNLADDLELESVELVALAAALRTRYGPGVDLTAYLTDLDLDQLIELTVGDLAGYVEEQTRADAANSPSGPAP